ncbi:MAG: hypothetical protein WA208_18665 [Thermoanaerobaculia bacterium]
MTRRAARPVGCEAETDDDLGDLAVVELEPPPQAAEPGLRERDLHPDEEVTVDQPVLGSSLFNCEVIAE